MPFAISGQELEGFKSCNYSGFYIMCLELHRHSVVFMLQQHNAALVETLHTSKLQGLGFRV